MCIPTANPKTLTKTSAIVLCFAMENDKHCVSGAPAERREGRSPSRNLSTYALRNVLHCKLTTITKRLVIVLGFAVQYAAQQLRIGNMKSMFSMESTFPMPKNLIHGFHGIHAFHGLQRFPWLTMNVHSYP